MGKFAYGTQMLTVTLPDHLLSHLEVLLSSKLRRGESFMLSWRDGREAGGGRSSVWVDRSLPMYFSLDSETRPPLDREFLEAMSVASSSPRGLDLSDPAHGWQDVSSDTNSIKTHTSGR